MGCPALPNAHMKSGNMCFLHLKLTPRCALFFPAIIHDLHNLGFRLWQENIKSSTHWRQSRSFTIFTIVSDLQTKQPERQTKKCSFCRHAPLKESLQLQLSMAAAGLGMLGAVHCASIGGNSGQHGRLVISGCEPWDSLNALSASSTMLLRLCELPFSGVCKPLIGVSMYFLIPHNKLRVSRQDCSFTSSLILKIHLLTILTAVQSVPHKGSHEKIENWKDMKRLCFSDMPKSSAKHLQMSHPLKDLRGLGFMPGIFQQRQLHRFASQRLLQTDIA